MVHWCNDAMLSHAWTFGVLQQLCSDFVKVCQAHWCHLCSHPRSRSRQAIRSVGTTRMTALMLSFFWLFCSCCFFKMSCWAIQNLLFPVYLLHTLRISNWNEVFFICFGLRCRGTAVVSSVTDVWLVFVFMLVKVPYLTFILFFLDNRVETARQRILAKGFTPDDFQQCLSEYERLDVWQLNTARTRITFVNWTSPCSSLSLFKPAFSVVEFLLLCGSFLCLADSQSFYLLLWPCIESPDELLRLFFFIEKLRSGIP